MMRTLALITFAYSLTVSVSLSTADDVNRTEIGPRRRSIRIILIRNGLACHNVFSQHSSGAPYEAHKEMRDAILTECGIASTRRAATLVRKYHIDFIGASKMLRAIETAYHLFDYRPVTVIPHIGEDVEYGPMNTPLDPHEQKQWLMDVYPKMKVNYNFLEADDENPSDWGSFVKFVGERLLPGLRVNGGKTQYTMALVTHGIFMDRNLFDRHYQQGDAKGMCKKLSPSKPWRPSRGDTDFGSVFAEPRTDALPLNNQMVEIFFSYDTKTRKLTLDTTRGCRGIGATKERPFGAVKPGTICKADFARCQTDFTKAGFLDEEVDFGSQCHCHV